MSACPDARLPVLIGAIKLYFVTLALQYVRAERMTGKIARPLLSSPDGEREAVDQTIEQWLNGLLRI